MLSTVLNSSGRGTKLGSDLGGISGDLTIFGTSAIGIGLTSLGSLLADLVDGSVGLAGCYNTVEEESE